MAIYVQIQGIDGDATHSKHEKWLDIDSMQWGVGRAIMTPTGSAANREASEPSVSEVTLTKSMDSSSAQLLQEVCTGHETKLVKIDLVTTGNPGDTYLKYELHNCLVSGYSVSTGGDRPAESVSLNFTKIKMLYIKYNDKHEVQGQFPAQYDLSSTKGS